MLSFRDSRGPARKWSLRADRGPRRESEHLRLVRAFADDPRDLGNFHLEHPLVDVWGAEGCLLGADAGRHVWIVSALDGEVPHDASPVLSEVGRCLRVHRRGHRTSATSRIESRQTSARSVSYRRSIRWVPSPLSMTMPPTQSIVPPKLVPTAERTALASFSLQ